MDVCGALVQFGCYQHRLLKVLKKLKIYHVLSTVRWCFVLGGLITLADSLNGFGLTFALKVGGRRSGVPKGGP